MESRHRASADKLRKTAENEVEDLLEQIETWEEVSSLDQWEQYDLISSLKAEIETRSKACSEAEKLADSLRVENGGLSEKLESETRARSSLEKDKRALEVERAELEALAAENEK
eukprot:Phypoly_transcript_29584.p2 GENE.Phypoly_transcript_29584~~Phypoly_transcript_29584.p2  ORF type:complete len:128 (+),score=33.20 Phypoly_transcript_29584:43-384(+)